MGDPFPFLLRRRKGDAFKVRVASRLRAETSVTLNWIAQRMQMGTRGYLTHLLYWQNRKKPKAASRRK